MSDKTPSHSSRRNNPPTIESGILEIFIKLHLWQFDRVGDAALALARITRGPIKTTSRRSSHEAYDCLPSSAAFEDPFCPNSCLRSLGKNHYFVGANSNDDHADGVTVEFSGCTIAAEDCCDIDCDGDGRWRSCLSGARDILRGDNGSELPVSGSARDGAVNHGRDGGDQVCSGGAAAIAILLCLRGQRRQ